MLIAECLWHFSFAQLVSMAFPCETSEAFFILLAEAQFKASSPIRFNEKDSGARRNHEETLTDPIARHCISHWHWRGLLRSNCGNIKTVVKEVFTWIPRAHNVRILFMPLGVVVYSKIRSNELYTKMWVAAYFHFVCVNRVTIIIENINYGKSSPEIYIRQINKRCSHLRVC